MSRVRPAGRPLRTWLVLVLPILAAFTLVPPALAITIPELYGQLPGVVGSPATVEAFYTDPADQLLVSDYDLFRRDEVLPPFTQVRLDGPPPPESMWLGAFVSVTGTVDTVHIDDPDWPGETVRIVLHDPVYVMLAPPPELSGAEQGMGFELEGPAATCDSCKFAVLISGGANANHKRYWNNLKNLYQYKTANAGYCPHNVAVLYAKGDSEEEAVIPGSAIDSCTKSNVQKAFSSVAKRVAECKARGRRATLQVLVTNHGAANGDINMLGSGRLQPGELKAMIQACIDSCLSELNVEMVQCYGGIPANGLKTLDDKRKTTMNVSSAAGDVVHWSAVTADGGYAPYLKFKLDSLRAGKPYEKAARGALAEYDSLLRKWGKEAERRKSVLWRSYTMNTYCEYRRVEGPAGGQLVLDFSGTVNTCGNVTVWEQLPDGRWVRRATWNHNVPAGTWYSPGNERRTLNAGPTAPAVFWIHNDAPSGKPYRIIAGSSQVQALVESPSNVEAYAGFSMGWRDSSDAEFGDVSLPAHRIGPVDQPGFPLDLAPRTIGPAGVQQLTVQFTNAGGPHWANMALWLNVNQVLFPGELWVDPGAPGGTVAASITAPGEYLVPLGPVLAPELRINEGLAPGLMAEFTLDSWGLRVMDEATDTPVAPPTSAFRVLPAHPHPFRPSGTLAFEIPRAARVRVAIYDLRGALVRTLADGPREAGAHAVRWDGRRGDGGRVPSGIYFFRVEAGPHAGGGKIVVLD